MQNYLKQIRPKANTLVDLTTFLEYFDKEKNKTLASNLLELMESQNFPKPVQKFFELPKFRALVEALHEGLIEPSELSSKEIHTLQLLLESFHKLVHLEFEYEEIEHPVVQAKVLEQNIHDYIACLELFVPYESNIVTEITSELFSTLHFFVDKFKSTILENASYFSLTLQKLMNSEIIALVGRLDKKNFPLFSYLDWYPVSIELNIDSKLIEKKKELTFLAKSNAHKILNQFQTHLGDISRIYLKNPKEDLAFEIQEYIKEAIESKEIESFTGQEINELFYEEFWKERYALLQTKEKILLSKLTPLFKEVYSLALSLHFLNENFKFALPSQLSNYIEKNLSSFEFLIDHLSKPSIVYAELANGFFTTQIEYMNESLSRKAIETIDLGTKTKLNACLASLVFFIKAYHETKPLTSFNKIKDTFENLYVSSQAYKSYPKTEILEKIHETLKAFQNLETPPLDLLEAYHHKLINEFKDVINTLPRDTTCFSIFEEKISLFEKIDLPSYCQTWHTIGQLLGSIFILVEKEENEDFLEALNKLKILFPDFFSAKN